MSSPIRLTNIARGKTASITIFIQEMIADPEKKTGQNNCGVRQQQQLSVGQPAFRRDKAILKD